MNDVPKTEFGRWLQKTAAPSPDPVPSLSAGEPVANLRLALRASEHNHRRDNEYLLSRAERAERELAECKAATAKPCPKCGREVTR